MHLALCVACAFVFSAPARADSQKKTQSLDDQLLEGLNADPLDEVDRELFAPDEGKSKPAPPTGAGERKPGTLRKDSEAWKQELLRELGAAAVSEDENPLLDVARQMRQAEGLIAETESGAKTQGLQEQIVARLEELIREARSCSKQCSPSQSSPKTAARQQIQQPKRKPKPGQAKPTQKPVTNLRAQPGKAAVAGPTPDRVRDLLKSVWGELPETDRQQMLEWAGDEFLPKYELLIELYFRRLAEGRRGHSGQ